MAKETIKFDGLDTTPDSAAPDMPNLYAGMHWNKISPFNTSGFAADNGYRVGTHSGNSIGFNDGGQNASFSSRTDFSLKSGYFTAGFAQGHKVTLIAMHDHEKVGQKVVHISDDEQTFVTFGAEFKHIDTVLIRTGNAQFTQVAMDDLRVEFDGAIPDAVHHHGHAPEHIVAAHEHALLAPSMHHDADHWMFC